MNGLKLNLPKIFLEMKKHKGINGSIKWRDKDIIKVRIIARTIDYR